MSKKPVYGYRRNRYGNVLEEDRFKEDPLPQPRLDSVDYDREDDHDNVYYNEMDD